jgi:hypothetical protein
LIGLLSEGSMAKVHLFCLREGYSLIDMLFHR